MILQGSARGWRGRQHVIVLSELQVQPGQPVVRAGAAPEPPFGNEGSHGGAYGP
jgi:hypothetical protein